MQMAKSKATLFIEACESGNIEQIRSIKEGRFKLSSKSTNKSFDNRFQQALSVSSKTKKEEDVVFELCTFGEDINELISENNIVSLVSSSRVNVLKILVDNGLDLGAKSDQFKYKTIYDRLFRNALFSRNVESMEYLITIFNYKWVYGSKLCMSICDPDGKDIIDSMDYRLQDRIQGFKSIYDVFLKASLLNKEIESLKILITEVNKYKLDIDGLVKIIVMQSDITEVVEDSLKKADIEMKSLKSKFVNFYELLLKMGITTDDIIKIVNS